MGPIEFEFTCLVLCVARDTTTFRGKISSDKWIDHVRTAFAVDPRIALAMPLRFPTNTTMQSEITQLVQVWFFFPIATFYIILLLGFFFFIISLLCSCILIGLHDWLLSLSDLICIFNKLADVDIIYHFSLYRRGYWSFVQFLKHYLFSLLRRQ
jgi:hypothetical protein